MLILLRESNLKRTYSFVQIVNIKLGPFSLCWSTVSDFQCKRINIGHIQNMYHTFGKMDYVTDYIVLDKFAYINMVKEG